MRMSHRGVLAFALLSLAGAMAQAAGSPQTVNVTAPLQIPGSELKPGSYNFEVEDMLADRAVVRISNAQEPAEHYFVLTVPNSKISVDSGDHLSYFKGTGNVQPVHAWQCADCSSPLEFVYPKAEAVKLTDDNGSPVMAVDPSYDKLPGNLSQDDMKVVTLWLLSPQRIKADNTGEGVQAAKYAATKTPSSVATASNASAPPTPSAPAASSAPAVPPPAPNAAAAQTSTNTDSTSQTAVASNESPAPARKHLPKTASNTYLYGLMGLFFLSGALATRYWRTQRL